MELLNKIGDTLNSVETEVLNPIGHCPGLSTLSGFFRSFLGGAEMAGGVFVGSLGLVSVALVVPVVCDLTLNKENPFLRRVFRLAFNCLVQGGANLIRGTVELIPGLNCMTRVYDKKYRLDSLLYTEQVEVPLTSTEIRIRQMNAKTAIAYERRREREAILRQQELLSSSWRHNYFQEESSECTDTTADV